MRALVDTVESFLLLGILCHVIFVCEWFYVGKWCLLVFAVASRFLLCSVLWGEVASLMPNAQPPTWRARELLFIWPLPFDLSGMDDLARSMRALLA